MCSLAFRYQARPTHLDRRGHRFERLARGHQRVNAQHTAKEANQLKSGDKPLPRFLNEQSGAFASRTSARL